MNVNTQTHVRWRVSVTFVCVCVVYRVSEEDHGGTGSDIFSGTEVRSSRDSGHQHPGAWTQTPRHTSRKTPDRQSPASGRLRSDIRRIGEMLSKCVCCDLENPWETHSLWNRIRVFSLWGKKKAKFISKLPQMNRTISWFCVLYLVSLWNCELTVKEEAEMLFPFESFICSFLSVTGLWCKLRLWTV